MSYKKLTPFQKALVESVLEEYKHIPAEADIQVQFSHRFERWAAKLIRKTKHTTWYYVNSPLKKAIIIAALIGLLTVTAAAIPAVREAFVDFFFKEQGVSYAITFDPEEAADAPKEILEYHVPSYIPEGFDVVEDVRMNAGVSIWCVNTKDEWIYYDQYVIKVNSDGTSGITINSEGNSRESRVFGDYLVEIIYDREMRLYYWTDNEYFYSIAVQNSLSEDVFVKMFESMTVITP